MLTQYCLSYEDKEILEVDPGTSVENLPERSGGLYYAGIEKAS